MAAANQSHLRRRVMSTSQAVPKIDGAINCSRPNRLESHVTKRTGAGRMSYRPEDDSHGENPTTWATVSTSYSSRSKRSDSRDSIQRFLVDPWDTDPGTAGSLHERLWKSQTSSANQREDQERERVVALLKSFDQQFGPGGVESSRPNLSPAIVDPPNFSPGQSSTTNAANQRWPTCPRCGANV